MTIHLSSISIAPAEEGSRLDRVLTSRFPGYSRSHLQRLIDSGRVTVNGNAVKKDYRVKKNDGVAIAWQEPETPSVAADAAVPFRVVFDGPEFAVVEKPAGIVTHPSASHKKGTLVNGLVARWQEIAGVGEDPLRPGIVHRLDKETSGLLVVAKTQPMFLWLKKQFQERTVEKKYIALVAGRITKKQGSITAAIARSKSRTKPKQIAISPMNTGISGKAYTSRSAVTDFTVLRNYKDFTLVEAMPKTGRMHQIRVHFSHIGHPVAGDAKYASRRVCETLPMGRHFLHAAALSFPLPDGTRPSFSSQLPPELEEVLKGL